jgi:DNA-binding NtrC family response regulator
MPKMERLNPREFPMICPATGIILPARVETTFHFIGKIMSHFFHRDGKTSPFLRHPPPPGIALESGYTAWEAYSTSRGRVWNPHCNSKGVTPGFVMAASATIHSVKRQTKPFGPIEAQIQRAIARIAESDCPVLIVGEHGVGKRSVAAQIHAQSHRSRGVYTEICGADADAQALRSAFSTKGTVYLSEIGDLNLALQELIVNSYFRSGEAQCSRLLCGSSRELLEEVKTWRMREDFYYLVSAVTLRISPLRCRRAEILSIADDLLTQYAKQFDRPKPVLREGIIGFLMEHSWPDNLSELQTAIKTFVAIGDQSISLAALKAAAPSVKSNGHRKPLSLKEATRAASAEIERRLIGEVMVATGGNRKRAADELRISYKALLYKLKRIGMQDQPPSDRKEVAL